MHERPRESLTWLPYVLPLALFLVLTIPEQSFGVAAYPIIYTTKVIAVSAVIWSFRGFYAELRPNSNGVVLSILAGPLLLCMWLVVDRFTPHFSFMGVRSAYNPFVSLKNQSFAWLFMVVRFFGLTVVAPVVEELFYRAFLLRWITDTDDFKRLPLGDYNTTAFVSVVVLMASAHPEYLAAAIFSAAMNLLLRRTRNLWSTVAAHASTNFCLGLYVLFFHAWKYW